MRSTNSRLILSVLLALGTSQAALGQFYSPYGYGGWGSYPVGNYNTTRNIAAQQQMQGQQIVAERNLALQMNVRTTMENQSQARNQAIMAQKQSDRDWWFQVQQQQVAERRGREQSAPMVSPPVATLEPSGGQTYSTERPVTPTETDSIIRWPGVLGNARFAEDRAIVEAPYRRAENSPSNPSASDYRNMLKATQSMKTDLLEMTGHISASQYLDANKFLSQLAGEVQGRLERMESSRKVPERTVVPEKSAVPEKVAVPEKLAPPEKSEEL